MSTKANEKKSAASITNAGVRLLKKLVYENYEDQARDNRGSGRQNVVGEAIVSVTGPTGQHLGDTRVFLRDTSGAGCGLWSRMQMPIGSTVLITTIAAAGGSGVQRLGRVRHCRGSAGSGFAVGVQFDSQSGLLGKTA